MIPRELAKEPSVGYRPPSDLPQRPVEADYLKGVPTDEFGNITHTPEGVPLTAKNIAGRGEVDEFGGTPDRGIGLHPTVRLAKEAGEGSVLAVPQARLGRGTVGDYDPLTNDIRYLNTLTGDKVGNVITHEVGHLIDGMAGRIQPKPGMDKELETIYHTLATGRVFNPKTMSQVTPESQRYRPAEHRGEYMAEAIREAVNTDKELSKWIQFNTAAGLLSGAAAADLASGDDDEKKDR